MTAARSRKLRDDQVETLSEPLDELLAKKRRLDKASAPAKKRPLSAPERTLTLCEMGECPNLAPPFVQVGPKVRRVFDRDSRIHHYCAPGAWRALCGSRLSPDRPNTGSKPGTCSGCHVEASRIRAVVER